jgi:signal transduction histidine kinase
MRRSLRLRLLVGAGLWVAGALIAAGIVIASLLRDFVEGSFDERLNTNLVAVISAVAFNDRGTLVAEAMATEPRFSQPLSGWYWQIADGRSVVLRSSSLWDGSFGSEVGAVGTTGTTDELTGPNGEALRAVRRDFTAPGGGGALRIVVAGPRAEIDEALNAVITPLLLSLAILGAGLVTAVMLQTGLGLRPLDRMRRDLAAVRGGDMATLPDPGYAELAPLIGELNGLIAHNRAVIERARTHVGNLAHGLKTPLAVLANAATPQGRDPDGSITATIRSMERLVEHHLRRARSAASRDVIGHVVPVAAVLADLSMAMRKIYVDRDLAIAVEAEETLRFSGDRHDLEEMAGNLFDNACKWAAGSVRVEATRHDGLLVLNFEDDGPGLPADAARMALGRGVRLDESAPGSGLGLAIVSDLARLYGGHLDLEASRLGGLKARLVLPAA